MNKPIENTGHEALRAMSLAPAFNHWMYSAIARFTKGEILEIGSGLGNISNYFIENGSSVYVSDIDEFYLEHLQNEYPQFQNGKNILSIDLQKEDFKTNYKDLSEKFDTVFLLNVLEHLEDEPYAIRNCKELLKKNGTLIILVPAYTFLYSAMDKALNHYRRYTTKRLKEILQKENLIIEKSFYFNAMGIPAWLWGKLMKYKSPPDSNMKFYDKLVPVGKMLDKIVFNKIGLSLIIVAKKSDPS